MPTPDTGGADASPPFNFGLFDPVGGLENSNRSSDLLSPERRAKLAAQFVELAANSKVRIHIVHSREVPCV